MFSDSVVASHFQLGRAKLKYLTNWWIAPRTGELLLNELDSVSFLAISFDENMNKSTQTYQMDLIV